MAKNTPKNFVETTKEFFNEEALFFPVCVVRTEVFQTGPLTVVAVQFFAEKDGDHNTIIAARVVHHRTPGFWVQGIYAEAWFFARRDFANE